MKEVFMGDQLTVLVHHCSGDKEVSIVNRMHHYTHDNGSFSLLDDVFFKRFLSVIQGGSVSFLHKIACVYHVSVLFSAPSENILLGIFSQLVSDFVHDALVESFGGFVIGIRHCENAEDLASQESPLGLIVWELVELAEVKEVLVHFFIRRVVLDIDLESQKLFL